MQLLLQSQVALRKLLHIRNRAARPVALLTGHWSDLSFRSSMDASKNPSRYKYSESALI
jgi:hypothetical protein